MIVNTPFFISPAYWVPRMTSSRRSKHSDTAVGEPVPEEWGSAGSSPAL